MRTWSGSSATPPRWRGSNGPSTSARPSDTSASSPLARGPSGWSGSPLGSSSGSAGLSTSGPNRPYGVGGALSALAHADNWIVHNDWPQWRDWTAADFLQHESRIRCRWPPDFAARGDEGHQPDRTRGRGGPIPGPRRASGRRGHRIRRAHTSRRSTRNSTKSGASAGPRTSLATEGEVLAVRLAPRWDRFREGPS